MGATLILDPSGVDDPCERPHRALRTIKCVRESGHRGCCWAPLPLSSAQRVVLWHPTLIVLHTVLRQLELARAL